MFTTRLKELQTLRSSVARLEEEVARDLPGELAGLPARFGFSSVEDFVAAVAVAAGVSSGRRGRPAGRRAGVPAKARRKRARITDEQRAAVKKMVRAGHTGAAIAKDLGISLPSVQNIKKAFGLVKERS